MKTEKDEAMRRELVSKGAVLDMLEEMGRREQRIYTGSRAPESFGALGVIFRAAGKVETMDPEPEAEPAGHWIPCWFSKPEPFKNVLVSLDYGEVSIGYRCDGEDGGLWFIDCGEANTTTKHILGWQYLPEPVPMETEAEE